MTVKMPSTTRRNSIASTASYHENDSDYEPSVVSEHDDRDWNDACLDDEVVATGVIKGSDNVASHTRANTRSKTHVESGSRRSERIRNKTIARIMFESANVGPRLRNRNTRN
jgi:hypothetical protein